MQNLAWWLVFAVMYMVIGYHIAALSRQVRKNWDLPVLDGIATLPLKLFLYPVVTSEAANGRKPFWLLLELAYSKPSYVVMHLFFWPFRIIGNLFVLVIFFLFAPMLAFLFALITRMVVGTIQSVAGKIKQTD